MASSSVSEVCPEVAAKNSQNLNASSLTLPPGTHLLMFGHSYLKQLFQSLGGANNITSSEWFSDGDKMEGVCGSSKRYGAPWCGYDAANCHTGDAVRHEFANGATVTGVFNYGSLQAQENATKLREFVMFGNFSHALVMEPHANEYFEQMKAIDSGTMTRAQESWKEPNYGCGWGDKFWSIWNEVMPGKVRHVVPWGNKNADITLTGSTTAAQSQPDYRYFLQSVVDALPCIVESKFYRQELLNSHGIQGHQCVAAYDDTGFFLGPVPYMMAGALEGFVV